MSSESLTISLPDRRELKLLSITVEDQENLRLWKNCNRKYFFNQNVIELEQQLAWFESFLGRKDDYMFMVRNGETLVGCMGIRLLSEGWDLYNLMLGNEQSRGKGLMSRALRLMLAFAAKRSPQPIQLRVLKSNPAATWYDKNGFATVEVYSDCFLKLLTQTPTETSIISITDTPKSIP